jgi:hypothetical protein
MTFDDFSADVQGRLVDAYAAGVSAGSGGPWLLDDTPETIALIDAITLAYFRSRETWQASRPAWPAEELIPEWFRAEQERAALADARPPESWLTRAMKEGKP